MDPRHDLLQPAALAEPYPVYDILRREAPMLWDERIGAWAASRYEDVVAALGDDRLAPRIGGTGIVREALEPPVRLDFDTVERRLGEWLTFLPAPAHRRRRAAVAPPFRGPALDGLRPRITAIAGELLDAVFERGRFEAISELARPLPVLVIGELLGVPDEERGRLKRWSSDILAYFQLGNRDPNATVTSMRRALDDMGELLRELVRRRRRKPREDLLSQLATARDGARLSEDEVVATGCQLLFAGHETTCNLLGNGLLTLLRHDEQQVRLRTYRRLVPTAVEECLRFDSPLQLTGRVALTPLELGGASIAEGQTVLLLIGSANRDPEQFERPDLFDPGRTNNRHLAFGSGTHFCLGAALARLEATLAFEALLERTRRLDLAADTLTWQPNFAFRGLLDLPVALEAA